MLGPDRDFARFVPAAEVVHFHGLWQRHTRLGCSVARRHDVPYLVAAHGMAEPWALRHKALKKRVYTAFVEGKNLKQAACLHALSRPEVGHLRRIAPKTPICLVPNGVDLAPFDDLPARSVLEAERPELAGKFVVLFFGRLHVKKGLDLLARATATVVGEHPSLHLLIAGADDGAKGPFQTLATALGIERRLTFVGHVAGEAARRVWGAADAFVLPSHSEGFSMAVLEALAARKPSLITTACHFPELTEAQGAVTVEPTVEEITRGLRDLLERSHQEREAMAERGRALVATRYTWDQQAARLVDVYRWARDGGEAPEAVVDQGF